MHLLSPDTPSQDDTGSLPDSMANVLQRLRRREDIRHQKYLEQLARVEKLAQEMLSATEEGAPSVKMVLEEQSRSVTPLLAVRDAVESFGECDFTLDQLCARIADRFPGECFSRAAISRRLYDLRQGQEPFVANVVSSDVTGGLAECSKATE